MIAPAWEAATACVLARAPLLESIRETLNAGPQRAETLALGAGLIAFVLLVALAAKYFGREPGTVAEPRIDYLTLAVDVLGFSESDRRDLQRIARQAGLEQPAAMLLSPENLARAAAPTLNVERNTELRDRVDDICRRLFNTPLPDPDDRPRP